MQITNAILVRLARLQEAMRKNGAFVGDFKTRDGQRANPRRRIQPEALLELGFEDEGLLRTAKS